jgi:hypothetical protein
MLPYHFLGLSLSSLASKDKRSTPKAAINTRVARSKDCILPPSDGQLNSMLLSREKGVSQHPEKGLSNLDLRSDD